MLSKNKIKLIKSLDLKKHRESTGLFVVEGDKMVLEMLQSNYRIDFLAATEEWYNRNNHLDFQKCNEREVLLQEEISKISFLKSPQNVLCVVEIPHYTLAIPQLSEKLSIILDTVQDPGNLGTILRIADWFGIEHVICSMETADVYNPKVVQSTMGAIARVKVHYKILEEILEEILQYQYPVYGTSLQGENIYNSSLPANGFILMGNESKGVNPNFRQYFTKELYIPSFPENQKRSESLNVAIATAIICAEFRRKN